MSMSLYKALMQRKRFIYDTKHVIEYLLYCLCVRRKRTLKTNPKFRDHLIYRKGESKIKDELDCYSIIKGLRH